MTTETPQTDAVADRNPAVRNPTYKKGARVAIINSTLGGLFFVECHSAEIVRKCRGADGQYMVRFDGETLPRFVDPAAQADPVTFVQRLNGYGRRTTDAALQAK